MIADTDGQNEIKGCEILGGTGTEFIWKYVIPESIPPVTTCSLEGDLVDGIYRSNVTVTLTAVDNGSGVLYTKYKLDEGAWVTYTTPFIVSDDGSHTVSFYSVDRAGNTETEKQSSFTILHTLPILHYCERWGWCLGRHPEQWDVCFYQYPVEYRP